MYFCDIENRETKELLSGVRIRSFWQKQMLVCAVELDADAVVPSHQHEHEQCGTVLSGEIHLTIDGEARTLKPGDAYIIPGGVEHSATAILPTRLFEVFSPVRKAYQY